MMPQVDSVLFGFEGSFRFQLIQKTPTDGDLVETSKIKVNLWFEGILQPMDPRKLLVKPEGQRSWRWWDLWTDLQLDVDQVIIDMDGNKYRVMGIWNWQQAGYNQYQLIEGETP